MSILSDNEIRKLCIGHTVPIAGPLISPFSESVSGNGIISYGLTSAGYDIRLSNEFKLFKNTFGRAIDPKMMKHIDYQEKVFDEVVVRDSEPVHIPPGGYLLGRSLERFCIPRNIKGCCLGKSTYARAGIIVNVTPLEPEWEGYLTIEISNSSICPAVVYAGEGIAQLDFHLIVGSVGQSYRDKGGKYQNQSLITPAIVE